MHEYLYILFPSSNFSLLLSLSLVALLFGFLCAAVVVVVILCSRLQALVVNYVEIHKYFSRCFFRFFSQLFFLLLLLLLLLFVLHCLALVVTPPPLPYLSLPLLLSSSSSTHDLFTTSLQLFASSSSSASSPSTASHTIVLFRSFRFSSVAENCFSLFFSFALQCHFAAFVYKYQISQCCTCNCLQIV